MLGNDEHVGEQAVSRIPLAQSPEEPISLGLVRNAIFSTSTKSVCYVNLAACGGLAERNRLIVLGDPPVISEFARQPVSVRGYPGAHDFRRLD